MKLSNAQITALLRDGTNAFVLAGLFRNAAQTLGRNDTDFQTMGGLIAGMSSSFMAACLRPENATIGLKVLYAFATGAAAGFLFMPVTGRPADTLGLRAYNGIFAGFTSAATALLSETTARMLRQATQEEPQVAQTCQ